MESEVLYVNSLAPKGPGTLHAAMQRCCEPSAAMIKRAICFNVSGAIKFPEDSRFSDPTDWEGCRFTGPKNVIVCGDSSPGGIVITGHPVLIEDPQNFTWRGITHVLEAPAGKHNASIWGGIRCIVSPGKTSKNVNFVNCSIVGGEDECAFGPSDWVERPNNPEGTGYLVPAFDGLHFIRCFVGYGTNVHRGYHNFGIMTQSTVRSSFVGNYFAHENRRCPQAEGFDGLSMGNITYNTGSMAFGCTKGTWSIINNLFVPGWNSKQTTPQSLPVQIAQTSGTVTRKGKTVFNLWGNRRVPYGNIAQLVVNDSTFCDNLMQDSGMALEIVVRTKGFDRHVASYPDAFAAVSQLHSVGARNCPYAKRAVKDLDVPSLLPPYPLGGVKRNGEWMRLVSGRISDLGIPLPPSRTYGSDGFESPISYENLVAGIF